MKNTFNREFFEAVRRVKRRRERRDAYRARLPQADQEAYERSVTRAIERRYQRVRAKLENEYFVE